MTDIELIAVPFDGYGRPGNQTHAARVLHDAGLPDAFQPHRIMTDTEIELPAADPARGEQTGLINETALVAMTDALNDAVGAALRAARFPVIYGGDCSTLLGIVTGLRDHAPGTGLVFIDGHEDTMPLDVSEDGEAANTEIGLLLGLTGRQLRGPLGARLPALRREDLVVIGPRDDAWRKQFNVGSLADAGVWLATSAETTADPASIGREALAALADVSEWWLHIDLDVLDLVEFPSQGLPDVPDEPGGLTWEQLAVLTAAMVERGGCVGFSLAIYDPDQDPDSSDAAKIVDFVRGVISRTAL